MKQSFLLAITVGFMITFSQMTKAKESKNCSNKSNTSLFAKTNPKATATKSHHTQQQIKTHRGAAQGVR